jgi:YHS domain-containing protein
MDGFMVNGLSSIVKNIMNPTSETSVIKSACGGILKDPSQYPSAMFNGERVHFCNAACLKAFLLAPEAFMAGEVEHPLEDVDVSKV